ncbi:MAG TPA: polyprenyl synthetase family protein [Flavipsychrobacter sp.]|nr:polyprenyl synthetase family protein [Flavipsychrobacter sp.]
MHSFTQLVESFEERFINTLPFPPQPDTLYEPCRYLLHLGGKRIRPVLCLMANELFGEINNDAWHAADAIELFHNFTLIHDDIMDKAPLRRGKPTVHDKYGMTAGILGGDVMCIYSYEHLSNIGASLPLIMHLFNKTAIEVCEGQQLDMDFELRNDVSIDEYIRMITLKTSVLLASSLKIGGLLGGATEGNTNKLYEFGKNLGIAFQLQDDYLDAYGVSDKLGKQQGGDIKSNKKTFLLLNALEHANDSQAKQIKELLQTDSDNKVSAMLSLFSATGADKACKEMMGQYSNMAFKCLEDVAALSKRKSHLHEIASYLLQRDK